MSNSLRMTPDGPRAAKWSLSRLVMVTGIVGALLPLILAPRMPRKPQSNETAMVYIERAEKTYYCDRPDCGAVISCELSTRRLIVKRGFRTARQPLPLDLNCEGIWSNNAPKGASRNREIKNLFSRTVLVARACGFASQQLASADVISGVGRVVGSAGIASDMIDLRIAYSLVHDAYGIMLVMICTA